MVNTLTYHLFNFFHFTFYIFPASFSYFLSPSVISFSLSLLFSLPAHSLILCYILFLLICPVSMFPASFLFSFYPFPSLFNRFLPSPSLPEFASFFPLVFYLYANVSFIFHPSLAAFLFLPLFVYSCLLLLLVCPFPPYLYLSTLRFPSPPVAVSRSLPILSPVVALDRDSIKVWLGRCFVEAGRMMGSKDEKDHF